MGVALERFDVFVVALDPTVGSEVRKSRPCIVVSPDELNRWVKTVIVVPLTTKTHKYPWRPRARVAGRDCEVMVDQLRSVDKTRLVSRIGRLNERDGRLVLKRLADFFAT